MDGEARLVVEAREGVRIQSAAVARGEAAVIAETLRQLGGGIVIASSAAWSCPTTATCARWLPCWSVRCSSSARYQLIGETT